MPSPVTPADFSLADLAEGTRAEHRYTITDACHRALTDAFGDVSPLHVDEDFAKRAGFEGRVMHGAILNGFVSHFVGVVLPGRRSLILSVDIRYAAPSYLGDEIEIRGEVGQRVESQGVVVLSLSLTNLTRQVIAARARLQVRVKDPA